MFNLKSLVAAATLLVGSVSAFNLPPHVPRGVGETPTRGVPGRIVTSCTVPRTAALTFVSLHNVDGCSGINRV